MIKDGLIEMMLTSTWKCKGSEAAHLLVMLTNPGNPNLSRDRCHPTFAQFMCAHTMLTTFVGAQYSNI